MTCVMFSGMQMKLSTKRRMKLNRVPVKEEPVSSKEKYIAVKEQFTEIFSSQMFYQADTRCEVEVVGSPLPYRHDDMDYGEVVLVRAVEPHWFSKATEMWGVVLTNPTPFSFRFSGDSQIITVADRLEDILAAYQVLNEPAVEILPRQALSVFVAAHYDDADPVEVAEKMVLSLGAVPTVVPHVWLELSEETRRGSKPKRVWFRKKKRT